MKKYLIMAAVLAFSIIVCLIDAVLQPNYFVKIPIKIVFFLALPMIFFIRNKEDFKDFKSLFIFVLDVEHPSVLCQYVTVCQQVGSVYADNRCNQLSLDICKCIIFGFSGGDVTVVAIEYTAGISFYVYRELLLQIRCSNRSPAGASSPTCCRSLQGRAAS